MTSKPQLEAAPGKPSQIIDHQMRTWRLCLKCDVYQLTEDSPLTCPTCQVEYGKTERNAVSTQIEMAKPEPTRYVLCDQYDGGCGEGFIISLEDYNAGSSRVCAACIEKHNLLAMLATQLKAARAFGHTHTQTKIVEGPGYSFEDVDCELCRVENEIDRLNELDGRHWREVRDRAIDRTMRAPRPLPWTPAGG